MWTLKGERYSLQGLTSPEELERVLTARIDWYNTRFRIHRLGIGCRVRLNNNTSAPALSS
ncbi:MAG: hypothetical protein OEW14_06095 [Nitrospira sp.]|nr:hypothetical protein [Nitrospira sp.]